jgi:hypothetical protein
LMCVSKRLDHHPRVDVFRMLHPTSVRISNTSLKLMDVLASLLCNETTTLEECSVACFEPIFCSFV